MLTPWKESYDQPRQHIKKQKHCFANKGPSSQGYGFSSSHVWMWVLDHKEGLILKLKFQILWPSDAKNWLIGKDPDAGKDWGQEETGVTEDEMVGWHHQLNGHEFEQTPGDSEGQGSLAATVHGVTKSQTQLRDWTTTTSPQFVLDFLTDTQIHITCCPWPTSPKGNSNSAWKLSSLFLPFIPHHFQA